MKVYPIFLNNLAGRKCVVIGGNAEAERKVADLLDCDASVTLISPDPSETLVRLVEDGRVNWINRPYRAGDLKRAFLVILCEPHRENAEAIWREGESERALVNVMDDVPHCSFVAGSVVRRGQLVISISTSGAAPALAVRLRQRLEAIFDHEYASFLDVMGQLRETMATRFPDFEERRRRWYEIVDSDILSLIGAGDLELANRRLGELVGEDLPVRFLTAVKDLS